MKKICYLLLTAVMAVSCQDEVPFSPNGEEATQPPTASTHTIPVAEALENLSDFMADANDATSRSESGRKVATVMTVKCPQAMSRSAEFPADCENIIYVANFENQGGYAILAADDRISQPIIAVVDSGNLNAATVRAAINASINTSKPNRPIFHGYPTTGPGFFTTPETGDEVFMNPNTVELYDSIVGDYLVGNYDISNDSITYPQVIGTSLSTSYAFGEIIDNSTRQNAEYTVDGSTPSNSTSNVTTYYSMWTTTKKVAPILSSFKYWTQSSPFNDLYPFKAEHWLFGDVKKAPAGCFPLSIAKLITYYNAPTGMVHRGVTIDLDELKVSYDTPSGRIAAAHLLHYISTECNSLYFYKGTFTLPIFATAFMKKHGFINAQSESYGFNRVKEMIDTKRPVIIYAIPGHDITRSHCWNIDGYKIKQATKTTKYYNNDILVKTVTSTVTCEMVHCDFGWGTNSNGHYVSGLFDVCNDNNERELDYYVKHDASYHFNHYIHLVTYNH